MPTHEHTYIEVCQDCGRTKASLKDAPPACLHEKTKPARSRGDRELIQCVACGARLVVGLYETKGKAKHSTLRPVDPDTPDA